MQSVDFRVVAILTVAVIAAVCDVRSRRIPNLLTFGGAAVALIYALMTGGINGFGFAAAGWLAGAALFFPFFALGGMGAGDVKLMAALAAWFGPGDAVWLAMFAAMAGGRLWRGRRAGSRLPAPGSVECLADARPLARLRVSTDRRSHAAGHVSASPGVRGPDHDWSGVHIMATLATVANRGERGQAIVELALTLPLLLLIVLGIFDFGFMFQKYEVVTNAAREGARVGVLPGLHGGACARPRASVSGRRRPHGRESHLRSSCGGDSDEHARVGVVSTATITGGPPAITVNQITVTVEYDYEYRFVGPIANTLFGGSLGTTRLTSVSTMRLESN